MSSNQWFETLKSHYSHRLLLGCLGGSMVVLVEGIPPKESEAQVFAGAPPRWLPTLITSLPLIDFLYKNYRNYKNGSFNCNDNPTKLQIAGFCLISIGSVMQMYCRYLLGKFYTFSYTVKRSHKTIDHSVYSIVRHPGLPNYFLCVFFCSCIVSHFLKKESFYAKK